MVVIFLRTVIIFITLMIVMRLMGKRQIGEMQSFELVITLIIADLACVPMADVSIPLTYGIVSILALFILHQVMSLLCKFGPFFKHALSGKPSIVINKDGVDFTELKKNDLDVEDLIEALRGLGYFSLSDVDYAVFEANGKISALPNNSKNPSETFSLLLIDEGKINKGTLTVLGKTEEFVYSVLKKEKLSLKAVGVMTVDGQGTCYLQGFSGKKKTFTVDLDGSKW